MKEIKDVKKESLILFGKKVREERLKRNLSQEQLGKLAKVHRTYVGMIERAEKNITLSNIKKFAHALGLDARDLIMF